MGYMVLTHGPMALLRIDLQELAASQASSAFREFGTWGYMGGIRYHTSIRTYLYIDMYIHIYIYDIYIYRYSNRYMSIHSFIQLG